VLCEGVSDVLVSDLLHADNPDTSRIDAIVAAMIFRIFMLPLLVFVYYDIL
jgi:hypothetical protein